ncbi:nuclear transport factor 2 family protein [Dyadobacter sp. CY323]|uniref:nuclear transport factor 2 family protein n=1 Tax=Dyadobacter sp. CY323 TaxID=2907302 RepID=UPI001F472EA1|nr:nuclear transport factor 2 family protein [Dyadobacter sp. CY323]MCE6989219.1 nuclear transport factor 2 family protein [Dyadobacter sp. CY323]
MKSAIELKNESKDIIQRGKNILAAVRISMTTVVLFLITLGSIATASGQVNFTQPIDGTECSNQFFKALLEKDAKAISNLVTNDFTVAGFQGRTINGQMLTQAIFDGYIVVDSGMLSGTNTRTYRDVTVVSGLWEVQAKIENNRFHGELSYLSVCVKSGGQWKVVAVQLSPVQ